MIKKGKKCPKCGGEMFSVTLHVTQTVEVDGDGEYISTISECDEVTHPASDDDIWHCEKCGYEAAGSEMFCKEDEGEQDKEKDVPMAEAETKLRENFYEISAVSALILADDEIYVPDTRELPGFCMELSKKFEKESAKEGWEDRDYLDTIEAYAKEHLREEYPPAFKDEKKGKPKEMRVKTPIGDIVVTDRGDDAACPGVDIDLISDKARSAAMDHYNGRKELSVPLVAVEYTGNYDGDGRYFKAHVYGNPDSDGPSETMDLSGLLTEKERLALKYGVSGEKKKNGLFGRYNSFIVDKDASRTEAEELAYVLGYIDLWKITSSLKEALDQSIEHGVQITDYMELHTGRIAVNPTR